MGFLQAVKQIELPNFSDLTKGTKNAKNEIKRVNLNTINVRYFSKSRKYFIPTSAYLDRQTDITVGIMEIPDKLSVIIPDDAIYYNKVDKTEWIDVKEGYPFAVIPDAEPMPDDDRALCYTDKSGKVKRYMLPLLINQKPFKAVRIKLGEKLPAYPDVIDVTQKFIWQIGNVKIIERLYKSRNEGLIVVLVLGIMIGAVIGMGIMGYILS